MRFISLNASRLRRKQSVDSDLDLLHTQLKLAQGALEETEAQLRRRDEELASIKTATSEASSVAAAQGNIEHPNAEAIQLLTAIQDTASFLEELACSFEAVDVEEGQDLCDLRLPKLISNTGNKSFQSILEHEGVRELHDKRFARAAAAMENDTQGNYKLQTPSILPSHTGWESTVAHLALHDEVFSSPSKEETTLEDHVPLKGLSAEDVIGKLSRAAKEIEQLLTLEKVRRLEVADSRAQELSSSVLLVDRVTDVELYLRRIQREIQANLMRVRLLDMRRDFVRRRFKAPDKLSSYTANDQLAISAGADFLRALQEPGTVAWRETRAAVPLDLHTVKKKDHRHLTDFSPLPRKIGNKPGLKTIVGMPDSTKTEIG